MNTSENGVEEIEITDEYQKVIERIEGGSDFIFVTGKAGTGKSTFIRYIRKNLRKNIAVVAPTGVAALNVRGQTIHSLFMLPPFIVTKDVIRYPSEKNQAVYDRMEVLIIDEISMVRADVLDGIDMFLKKARSNNLPFGGVQVIAVGDLFQLPPVVNGEKEIEYFQHHYANEFFFGSNVFKSLMWEAIEFTKIYRQKDETFIKILNAIRDGNQANIQKITEILNRTLYGKKLSDSTAITLTCTNSSAEQINTNKLNQLTGKQKIYTGVITGKFDAKGDRLPAPEKLILRPGAQVMFTKNDPSRRWVNGTIGLVKALHDHTIMVEVPQPNSDSKLFEVERESWETYSHNYDRQSKKLEMLPVGSYTQYPLMLAWAVTIHKSQGQSFDSVNIDFGRGAFAPGQAYVALSRARSLKGMSLLSHITPRDIIYDNTIYKFYQSMEPRKIRVGNQPIVVKEAPVEPVVEFRPEILEDHRAAIMDDEQPPLAEPPPDFIDSFAE